jgi:hypothetical protein
LTSVISTPGCSRRIRASASNSGVIVHYEIALANLEPRLRRRAAPVNVEAVLGRAGEPLATAEVAAVMGTDMRSAKEALKAVAVREVVGPEAYWSPAP